MRLFKISLFYCYHLNKVFLDQVDPIKTLLVLARASKIYYLTQIPCTEFHKLNPNLKVEIFNLLLLTTNYVV